MPRAKKEIDIREVEMPPEQPRVLRSTGGAKDALDPPVVEPVKAFNKDKADMLQFLEEPVEIIVNESTNPVDEQIIEVGVNGVPQRFQRGVKQTVKRKFIQQLARKLTRFSQTKGKDPQGIETYVNQPHSAARYPFTILSDPNPKGRAWLDNLMQQA
jgi:hypothetical protein